jgi:hypothetical protein
LKGFRWALGELNRLPGEPGIYLDNDIQQLVQGLRITRALNRWGEEKKLFRVHD